ncbi:MAG: SGNH/GDSL hydrolase family protein, partial [Thermoanaerobaculia bacterium]
LVPAIGEIGLRLAPREDGFVDTALDEESGGPLHWPDFRGRRGPGGKRPGRFRVLVLGDSFAWGYGVHAADAWPLRLERRLASARPDLDPEVVNWSRTGWNTEQAWRSVQPRLSSLDPDLVILNFTLNDAEPTNMEARARLIEPLERRAPGAAPSQALYAHSVLYRLFWDRLENRRQRRAFVEYYEELFEGLAWQACLSAMSELRTAAGEQGAPLLLVVFPVFDSQLDDPYSYRRLHDTVGGGARELDIPVLDLLGELRGVDARRLALTPFTDPHPSELAHRLAADLITRHLLGEGLVPVSTAGERRPVREVSG